MADVVDAFIRGSQAAQLAAEHKQAMETNSLHQMVLKHQLSASKLEDALRQHDLQIKYAQLGLGQPDEEGNVQAPAQPNVSAAPSQQPIPPAGGPAPEPPHGIADVVSNLVGQRLGMPAPQEAPAAIPSTGPVGRHVVGPDGVAVNLHADEPMPEGHQAVTAPPTNFGDQSHPTLSKDKSRIFLSAIKIPELGIDIPGQWFSAKAAAEEQSRRAIALKRAEAPLHNVPIGATALGVDQKTGNYAPVYTNTTPKPPTRTELMLRAGQGDEEAQRALEAGRGPKQPALHVINGSLVDNTGKVIVSIPSQRSGTVAGGPTLAQRAIAERWKGTALAALEKAYKASKDAFGSEPMSEEELQGHKDRIQQSYLQQIGASTTPAATSAKEAGGVPAGVAAALKGQATGKRYRTSQGTFDVLPDGSIQPVASQ